MRFLRALSPPIEFAIVIAVAFGLPIFTSVSTLVWPDLNAGLSNAELVSVVVYELIVVAALFTFLRIRGWTFARIGLRPAVIDTLIGVALAAAGYLAFFAAYAATASVWPQAAAAMRGTETPPHALNLAIVLAVALVNPLFEETFVCGYVITALKQRPDPWTGINVSVAIRLLYHLYQGAVSTINVVPSGLILGLWYARTGRLWPVVVAHVLWDFLPLAYYARW